MISDVDKLPDEELYSLVQAKIESLPQEQAADEPQREDWSLAERLWDLRTIAPPPHEDILWAYRHLEAPSIAPTKCPSRGAWALLLFGRGNPKDFLTRLLPQATAEVERRRQEQLAKERAEELEKKAKAEAKAKRKRPPLPENEEKSIADIEALLATAIKESVGECV